jgi:hypothetical protein
MKIMKNPKKLIDIVGIEAHIHKEFGLMMASKEMDNKEVKEMDGYYLEQNTL